MQRITQKMQDYPLLHRKMLERIQRPDAWKQVSFVKHPIMSVSKRFTEDDKKLFDMAMRGKFDQVVSDISNATMVRRDADNKVYYLSGDSSGMCEVTIWKDGRKRLSFRVETSDDYYDLFDARSTSHIAFVEQLPEGDITAYYKIVPTAYTRRPGDPVYLFLNPQSVILDKYGTLVERFV